MYGSWDAKWPPCRMQKGQNSLKNAEGTKSNDFPPKYMLISQSITQLQLWFCAVQINANVTCFIEILDAFAAWLGQKWILCSQTQLWNHLGCGNSYETVYFIGCIIWLHLLISSSSDRKLNLVKHCLESWKYTLKARSVRMGLNQGMAM